MRWLKSRDKNIKRRKSVKVIVKNQEIFTEKKDGEKIDRFSIISDTQSEAPSLQLNDNFYDENKDLSVNENIEVPSTKKQKLRGYGRKISQRYGKKNASPTKMNHLKVNQRVDQKTIEQRQRAALIKMNNEKVGRFTNPTTKYDRIRKQSGSIEDLNRLGIRSVQSPSSPLGSATSSLYNSWETVEMKSPQSEKRFDFTSPVINRKIQLAKQNSK